MFNDQFITLDHLWKRLFSGLQVNPKKKKGEEITQNLHVYQILQLQSVVVW